MSIVSTGQITIVDNNDARPITASITSNIATTQIYTKDESTVVFNPDYASTPLVLTPRIYMAGAGSNGGALDISGSLTNMKWSNSIAGASLGAGLTYTINGNQTPNAAPKEYFFEADYADPLTGLVSRVVCSTTVSILNTGTNAVYVLIGGVNIIEQSDTASKNFVELKADVVRAGGIDNTGITYRWFEMPSNVQVSTSIAGYASKYGFKTTAGAGGLNQNVPANGAFSDAKSIIVAEPAVTSIQSYRVEAKDADGMVYQAYVTVYDKTDPYLCVVRSTSGDKLQNGVGSTTLFPEVWSGAAKVADTTGWTFTWSYADANGVRAGFVDTDRTIVATGKPITANTAGANAVITYSGTPLGNIGVNDMVKLVRANGTVGYYELLSASGNTVTLRVPATTLTYLTSAAPTANEFVGGVLFQCTGNGGSAGQRTTNGGNSAQAGSIVVTGFDIDGKGTISCSANRP